MRDLGSIVSRSAVLARLGKHRFPVEPEDKWLCIPFLPGCLLHYIPSSTVPAIRQAKEEEEITSGSPPGSKEQGICV